ncbi:GIY-YIG nuclease family protein [Streptomyces sp. MAD19A]|uniref:GIY-YIG nuclease family protein n=1 Tax=Streptomyces TaxID=1883 RepID=UPI0035282390
MANRTSTQNLRKRVRYHYRGNAAGSTLRLTLGCLLGMELRRVGSGKRMTFGKAGEATLSQWMADNARVCWIERSEPWDLESAAHLSARPTTEPRPEPSQRVPHPPEGATGPSTPASAGAANQLVVLADGSLSGPSLGRPRLLGSDQ